MEKYNLKLNIFRLRNVKPNFYFPKGKKSDLLVDIGFSIFKM